MAYLNLDLDYFSHPKVVRLVGLLGRGSEVLPIKLWTYCGKYHAESGKLTDHSAQEIESIVGWWGKRGQFVEAMRRVGFIVDKDGEFSVHEWSNHQGHIQALKDKAKRAAKNRWSSLQCPEQSPGDAQAMPRAGLAGNAVKDAVVVKAVGQKQDRLLGMPFSNEFLKFWEAYPRKINQSAAAREWDLIAPGKELLIVMMGALSQQKAFWTSKGTDLMHVPHADTWLKDRRWLDVLDTAPPPPKPAPRCPACGISGPNSRPSKPSRDGKRLICESCSNREAIEAGE